MSKDVSEYRDPAGRHDAVERVILLADLADSVPLYERSEALVAPAWRGIVEALREFARERGARVVRLLGDSALLLFDRPADALGAAEMLHRRCADFRLLPAGFQLRVRIGVHVGAVYEGPLDVHGHAVNFTARLMSAATPGETWVSPALRDRLTDGGDARFEDLGLVWLKGMEQPQRVLRVGPAAASGRLPLTPAPLLPAVAVLPLQSWQGAVSGQDARLGDMLAEEIAGQLVRLRGAEVISALSARSPLLHGLDEAQAAAQLHASYLVSGRFDVDGRRLRLHCDVVETRSRTLLATHALEARLADLFEDGDGPARSMAVAVAKAVSIRELERATSCPLPTLEAYTLLHGALGLMHRLSPVEFEASRGMLTELATRQGRSGLAHAWMSMWHVLRSAQGWTADHRGAAVQARTHADLALQSNPLDARALALAGHVHGYLFKDQQVAGEHYQRAIDANPNEPLAWLFMSLRHAYAGEADAASESARTALRLSPLDPLKSYFDSLAATALLSGGHWAAAEELARDSIRQNRRHASTWRTLVRALVEQGKGDAARDAARELLAIEPGYTVGAFRERFPGRDGPMAEPWAVALAEAGVPP